MRRKRSNKWSNSRLNAYQNCPRQYKFKYVEKGNTEEFLSISIIVGSVFHNVIEKMYKDFYLKGIIPLKEILEYFEVEWEKKLLKEEKKNKEIVFFANIKDIAVYKKYSLDCVKRYYEKFYITGLETDFDSCKTEEIVEPFFFDDEGEKIEFQGFIDRFDIKGDVLTIVDYKTSRQAPSDRFIDKAFTQLYLYALGVKSQERFKNIKTIKLKLIYPFPGIILEREVDDDSINETRQHYIDILSELKSDKKFLQTPGFGCISCGYRRICPEFRSIYRLKEKRDDLVIKDVANMVDKLVLLKQKISTIEKEVDQIKESILHNKDEFLDGEEEGRFVLPGAETGSELVVNIEKVRKLPDSKDAMREVMVQELIKKGFWEEIATLNSISVNPKIKNNAYSRELMDFLSDYIYEDQESSRVTVRKSKKK